jgi:FYVE zinc finger
MLACKDGFSNSDSGQPLPPPFWERATTKLILASHHHNRFVAAKANIAPKQPDPASPTCDSTSCQKTFTFFQRRHHCRRCGSIFCSEHSLRQVPLDQHARFHPLAPSFRACDDCYRDFRVWDAKRRAKNQAAGEDIERTGSADGVPGKGVEIQGQGAKKGLISSIAQSVPRDWNWSTF